MELRGSRALKIVDKFYASFFALGFFDTMYGNSENMIFLFAEP